MLAFVKHLILMLPFRYRYCLSRYGDSQCQGKMIMWPSYLIYIEMAPGIPFLRNSPWNQSFLQWNENFVFIWNGPLNIIWNKYNISIQNGLMKKLKVASFNSLRPSDAMWQQRSGWTLAQVMACCLTAPSHYWTNVDLSSVRSSSIHLRAILPEMPHSAISRWD